MSDVIATDTEALEVDSSILEFYELHIGTGTNNVLYFHPGKDLDGSDANKDITFDGEVYVAMPILMEGIEKKSDGAMAKPTLTIANVESIIKNSSDFKTRMDVTSGDDAWDASFEGQDINTDNFTIDSLVGSRVVRRKTFEKYTGNATVYEFPKETYIIDRISSKNLLFIELELSSPADMSGYRVPSRVIIGKYCPWLYQGNADNPTKSACYWKGTEQVTADDLNYTFYFTKDDEPLVLLTHFTGGSNTAFYKGTWANGTTYAVGEYVVLNGIYYRSEYDSNTGNSPALLQYWQIVRTYSTWSGSTTYNINTDPRKSDYVRHSNQVWRNVKASNLNITPGTDPTAWVRGDVCGKMLKSCKIRYQAVPKAIGNSRNVDGVPDANFNTYASLPFGGFPASRKFG